MLCVCDTHHDNICGTVIQSSLVCLCVLVRQSPASIHDPPQTCAIRIRRQGAGISTAAAARCAFWRTSNSDWADLPKQETRERERKRWVVSIWPRWPPPSSNKLSGATLGARLGGTSLQRGLRRGNIPKRSADTKYQSALCMGACGHSMHRPSTVDRRPPSAVRRSLPAWHLTFSSPLSPARMPEPDDRHGSTWTLIQLDQPASQPAKPRRPRS